MSALVKIIENPFDEKNEVNLKVKNGTCIKDIKGFDENNSFVYVNGKHVNNDYILKKNDACVIRQYPSAISSSLIVNVLFWSAVAFTAGEAISFAVSGRGIFANIGLALRKWLMPDVSDASNADQITNLPSVSGSKNQSAFGRSIPLILGKTYFAPYVLGQPYNTIGGDDGENDYYHCLYLVGYHNVKIEDISMGLDVITPNTNNVENGQIASSDIGERFVENKPQIEIRNTGEVNLYDCKVIQENFSYQLKNTEGNGNYVYAFSARYPKYVELELALNGLVGYNGSGEKQDAEAKVTVEYSIDGGTTWINCSNIIDLSSATGSSAVINTLKAIVKADIIYDPQPYQSSYRIKSLELSIDTGYTYSEDIQVQYWTGSAWITILELPAGGTSAQTSGRIAYINRLRLKSGEWTSNDFSLSTGSTTQEFSLPDSQGVSYILFKNQKTQTMRYALKHTLSYNQMESCDEKVVHYRVLRINPESTETNVIDKVYVTAIRTWCYDATATEKWIEEHPSAEEIPLISQIPMNAKERDKTCRIGLVMKVTDDVQKYFDKINLIATSKARTWNGTGWSKTLTATRNPASLALLAMTGDFRDEAYRYKLTESGDYVTSDKIDLDDFGTLYERCDAQKDFGNDIFDKAYYCDGAVLNGTKGNDLVNNILNCARSNLIINGNKYGIFTDKEQSYPLLALNNNNLLGLTYSKNFEEIPDGQSIKYISALNFYQQDTIVVKPYGASPVSADDKLENVEYPFITDPYHAKAMSLYQQACRKLRPETMVAKVTGEGGLAEIGSLVSLQSDRVLIGIGDGAEITELVTSGNNITGIKTDGRFVVTDISKDYGVVINVVDSNGNEKILRLKLARFAQTGTYSNLTFANPLSTSASAKPEEGCIISFGLYESEVIDTLCIGKDEKGDGTYELTLVGYDEEIYEADEHIIHDFDPKTTSPKESGQSINFGVPTVPVTPLDVITLVEGLKDETEPDYPTLISAVARQNYIELKWKETGENVARTVVEISRDSGTTWTMVESIKANTYNYYFDRSVDLYPEESGLGNYRFRLKNVSTSSVSSDWAVVSVDTTNYGTWQPATPTFTSKIPDEGGIVFNWSPAVGANSRSLYGTNSYEVKVYYDGTLRDTISTVETNCVYNFNRSSDGYPELTHSADYTGLDLYTFTLKAINNSGNDAITTAQSFSQSEKADYGTWIPSAPAFTKKDAERDGFNIEWNIPEGSGSRKIYGGITYRVDIDYNGSNVSYINTDALRAFYSFDRSVDLYPEKHINVETGDRDLSLYTIKIKAINTVVNSRYTQGSAVSVDVTNYLTWKLPTITVQDEVVDRTTILTALYNSPNIYGTPRLKVRIKRIGNLDEVEGEPFNDYLGITADSSYYTPNFEDSPQPSTTNDTETNYRTSETDAFISTNNKVTQTLPLLGQCPRIFNDDGYVMMTYLVQNETTEPANPQDGQVMRYVGQTTTDLENGKYYQYNLADDEWVEVISKTVFVPTIYKYELQLTNESGNVSNIVEREITALCTSIADVVHSHEHYKDLYVEKLSAINANLGMISQGGMGDFDPNKGNYWALSNLTSDDTGIAGGVKKGAFRVGGEEQYFKVTPLGDDKYDIELKAGNITLTSSGDGTSFREGTYIYDSTDSHKRLWLTPTGIVAQIEVNRGTEQNPVYEWENLAKVLMDSNGNVIITNSETQIEYGIQIEGGDIYHFDSEAKKNKDEDNANPQSITVTGSVVPVSGLSPILDPTSSATCVRGTVEKSISSFTGRMVFFSKSDTVEVEGQKLIKTDGSIRSYKSTQYNELMTQTKDSGTVGSYLGLSESQISNEIFINIGE